jgi:hypothetical protein
MKYELLAEERRIKHVIRILSKFRNNSIRGPIDFETELFESCGDRMIGGAKEAIFIGISSHS